MKKFLFAILLVLALAIVTYGLALADNGPHGGFGPVTDACAGCHRAHTGQAAYLLLSTGTALCESCHGASGTGADTNVWNGIYVERDGVTETPAEGVAGRGLKGGGFAFALMDTNLDGSAPSSAVTSKHNYDGSSGTIWGNGALNSGAGPLLALSCTNCHNPHGRAGAGGTATFRILRRIPSGSNAPAADAVDVADETDKLYTIADPNGMYFDEPYGTRSVPMANWFSQCHTRYWAPSGSATTSSDDAIFNYRHATNSSLTSCMSCHVAHGTSASMGVNSGAVAWPNGAITPSGNARSSLLREDNRGVCYECHATP